MARNKWKNLTRLKAKLDRIRKQTEATILPALQESAAIVVAEQKRLAPVDEGDLKDSIGSATLHNKFGRQVVRISAGGREAPHAPFVEFGTQDAPAQPYFLPAWRSTKRKVKSKITRAVRAAVKNAVK